MGITRPSWRFQPLLVDPPADDGVCFYCGHRLDDNDDLSAEARIALKVLRRLAQLSLSDPVAFQAAVMRAGGMSLRNIHKALIERGLDPGESLHPLRDRLEGCGLQFKRAPKAHQRQKTSTDDDQNAPILDLLVGKKDPFLESGDSDIPCV